MSEPDEDMAIDTAKEPAKKTWGWERILGLCMLIAVLPVSILTLSRELGKPERNKEDIETIKTRLKSLETDYLDFRAKITKAETELELRERTATLVHTSINEKIADMSTKISLLDTDVDKLQSENSILNAKVMNLQINKFNQSDK